jgi:hypothetical protein
MLTGTPMACSLVTPCSPIVRPHPLPDPGCLGANTATLAKSVTKIALRAFPLHHRARLIARRNDYIHDKI